MCMLLGFSANKKYEIKSPLKNFFGHSHAHPDGWGLALCTEGIPLMVKEPMAAYKSSFLSEMCNGSIKTKLAIAHIRKKTCGNTSFLNTHPFIQMIKGKEWIMAHNGSVDFSCIRKRFSRKPLGETDSEKAFCLMASSLENADDSMQTITSCLEKDIMLLSQYGKLNLLITDGQKLFVHSNYANSLYMCQAEDAVMFATTPVIRSASWKQVPLNRLMVYENGGLVYIGEAHPFQYAAARFSTCYMEGVF